MSQHYIQHEIIAEVPVTPIDAAAAFCAMSADEQAQFFNDIAIRSRNWSHPFCFQMQYLTDSKMLSAGGRGIMSCIGEYAVKP